MWVKSLLFAALAAVLLWAVAAWRLGGPVLAVAPEAAAPAAAPVAAVRPAAAPAPLTTAPLREPSVRSQGKLVRAPDGQLYEDFPDGRRVLHTTVRMRDGAGREWDEPVEIEATPVDPRKRDTPPVR